MLDGFRLASENTKMYLPLIRYNYEQFYDECKCAQPYMIYLFLRERFGKGEFIGEDEHKMQWRYFIKTPHGFIEIYDKRRTSIYFWPYSINKNKKCSEIKASWTENYRYARIEYDIQYEEIENIPPELKNDIKEFITELNNFCRNYNRNSEPDYVHRGQLILNPYYIHYSNFKYHYKMLKRSIRKLQSTNNFIYKRRNLIKEEIENLKVSTFILLIASLEGFINLLYEFLLKKVIRKNNKILKQISNSKTIDKIIMLPIYCSYVNDTKCISETSLNNLKKLYELRNRLIHANISRFEYNNIIEIDNYIFQSPDDEKDSSIKPFLEEPDKIIEFIDNAKKTIDIIRNEILKSIEIQQRKQLRKILNDRWIGYVNTPQGIKIIENFY